MDSDDDIWFLQSILSGFGSGGGRNQEPPQLKLISAAFRNLFPSIDVNTVSLKTQKYQLVSVETTCFPIYNGLHVNVSGEAFFLPENTVASLQRRHKID